MQFKSNAFELHIKAYCDSVKGYVFDINPSGAETRIFWVN